MMKKIVAGIITGLIALGITSSAFAETDDGGDPRIGDAVDRKQILSTSSPILGSPLSAVSA